MIMIQGYKYNDNKIHNFTFKKLYFIKIISELKNI